MGAHPYWYFTAYEADLNAALAKLRRREFEAGRYNPVVPVIAFPIGPASRSPGAKHRSIDEAREAAAEDGTRSILDIDRVGDEPDFCVPSINELECLRDVVALDYSIGERLVDPKGFHRLDCCRPYGAVSGLAMAILLNLESRRVCSPVANPA